LFVIWHRFGLLHSTIVYVCLKVCKDFFGVRVCFLGGGELSVTIVPFFNFLKCSHYTTPNTVGGMNYSKSLDTTASWVVHICPSFFLIRFFIWYNKLRGDYWKFLWGFLNNRTFVILLDDKILTTMCNILTIALRPIK